MVKSFFGADAILDEGTDDDLDRIVDDGSIKLTKSEVIHIRVDPEMKRKLRALARKIDRKPCDIIRRALQIYMEKK